MDALVFDRPDLADWCRALDRHVKEEAKAKMERDGWEAFLEAKEYDKEMKGVGQEFG